MCQAKKVKKNSPQKAVSYSLPSQRAAAGRLPPGDYSKTARHRFQHVEGILRVFEPDATLRREYSITMDERGKIIRAIAAVRPKMKIRTPVGDGEFGSEIL
jgi:exonuclease VII large subunit